MRALFPRRYLDQLGKLLLRQRLADELQRHRILHHAVEPFDRVGIDHALGKEFVAHALRGRLRHLVEFRVVFHDLRVVGVHVVDALTIGRHEAVDRILAFLERLRVGDDDADGLAAHQGRVGGLGDHADLAGVDFLQPERRRGPADIDLVGHHLRQRRRRIAGRHRLCRQLELVDEGAHDALRRRALGREGDGVAVGVGERFDRRRCLGVPVVGSPGRLGTDDAHRRALGIGRHRALRADGEAEIGGAGDHRLQRLARARGVDDLERDTVLLEDAGLLAEIGHRGVPVAALADRDLEEIIGCGWQRDGEHRRRCQRNF